ALHPFSVAAGTAASVLLAYAALYRCLSLAHPHYFAGGRALSIIDSVYLSVTAGTVGFGDFYPRTSWAEIAVMSPIAVAVTFLSLSVTYLTTYFSVRET